MIQAIGSLSSYFSTCKIILTCIQGSSSIIRRWVNILVIDYDHHLLLPVFHVKTILETSYCYKNNVCRSSNEAFTGEGLI